jgi:glutamine synthetase
MRNIRDLLARDIKRGVTMPRQESLQTELKRLLRAHPDTDVMELLIPDVTGVLRSKRIRRRDFDKTLKDGFSLPGGAVLLDTTGDVIEGIPWSADDGDPDVNAKLVKGSFAPVPWAARPMAQAMFRFYSRDGERFFADPRTVLERAVAPLKKMGLTIVMATELEFYLLDGRSDRPTAAVSRVPGTGRPQPGPQVYHPDDLWDIDMSLVDRNGRNYFSQGKESMASPPFSARLRHAVGGVAKTMAESTAIFAPNANSYRRLRPEMFAPVEPNWGTNHRNVSLRIPVSDEKNLRFEHRTSGADANPYLVTAAIAAGVHYGLKNKCDPGRMVEEGEVITLKRKIPNRWDAAIDKFSRSKILPEYLGDEFCRLYALHRRDESRRFHNVISNVDFDWYLRAV